MTFLLKLDELVIGVENFVEEDQKEEEAEAEEKEETLIILAMVCNSSTPPGKNGLLTPINFLSIFEPNTVKTEPKTNLYMLLCNFSTKILEWFFKKPKILKLIMSKSM